MDIAHPLNQKAVAYLSRRNPTASLIASVDSVPDPYLRLGSHPEIVERLWKQIAPAFISNIECRWIVFGTPALVQPTTGVILAAALGTQYCLRLPGQLRKLALQAGCKTIIHWSPGHVTDIELEFGDDWLFGKWLPAEIEWCREAFGIFGEISAPHSSGF